VAVGAGPTISIGGLNLTKQAVIDLLPALCGSAIPAMRPTSDGRARRNEGSATAPIEMSQSAPGGELDSSTDNNALI
jgi:hypothetical protein